MTDLQIAIPLFDRFTALDAIGPYEVLQRLPGARVTFVGERRGEVRTDNGFLGVTVDATFDELPRPDVLVVPGGVGSRAFLDGGDHALLAWVAAAHPTTRYTTSVCTGSLILGAAGLLRGLTATTYWSAYDRLTELGATPVAERVVEHLERRLITAAGVSSGIDMALRLSELLFDEEAARAMQLMVEYDPQPPFASGSAAKASAAVHARAREFARTKA